MEHGVQCSAVQCREMGSSVHGQEARSLLVPVDRAGVGGVDLGHTSTSTNSCVSVVWIWARSRNLPEAIIIIILLRLRPLPYYSLFGAVE